MARIDASWVSAPATPFLELPEASGAQQHQVLGAGGSRVFHSSVWRRGNLVGTLCTQTQCNSTLRNCGRARHNTQLCSNRLVTEAGPGRPRELPAA